MSTERTQAGDTREQFGKTIDQMLVKLAIISPIALLLLLTSDQVRSFGDKLIPVGILLALAWVLVDQIISDFR